MADGSIFSGIMGDISSFGDALSGLASGATNTKTSNLQGESDAALYRSLRLESALNNNKTNQPYSPQSFRAGQAAQTDATVNPDTINAQWLQRLNRYSSIPEVQGAQARKAY